MPSIEVVLTRKQARGGGCERDLVCFAEDHCSVAVLVQCIRRGRRYFKASDRSRPTSINGWMTIRRTSTDPEERHLRITGKKETETKTEWENCESVPFCRKFGYRQKDRARTTCRGNLGKGALWVLHSLVWASLGQIGGIESTAAVLVKNEGLYNYEGTLKQAIVLGWDENR